MNKRMIHDMKVGEIYVYVVSPGDNVYRIARMYNSDVNWIGCMNHLNKEMLIYPNQQLYIPVLFKNVPPRPNMQDSYELYF